MKTLKTLATCAFLAIAATAWAETLGNLQPLVQLSSLQRDFAGTAQAGKLLKVEGLSSTKWTAKSNVSWIKLTKASGKGGESVSYSVEENEDDEDREGEITVISNGESSTFTVRQAADVFTISPNGHYILPPGQSEFTLSVKSGGTNEWKAKSHQSWVTIKSGASGSGNGKITCSVKVNKTGKPRICRISVLKNHQLKTHWSEQRGSLYDGTGWAPGWVALTSTEREFTYAASSNKELKVKSNTFWEAYTEDGWINLETLEGAGNGTIVYGVDANKMTTERTGTIKVTGGENTVTFTVKQKGRPTPKLTLGASSASLGATGTGASGKTVAVTSNQKWTAKSQDSWIKVTGGASGSGNGTVAYYVGAYMDAGTRSGSITVEGGGMTRSFTVHQKGPDPSLSLGSASRTFAASGGTAKELKVTGNVSWTAKSSASWLTVKKGSGKGGGTIVYDVAKNTGKEGRAAAITVTGGGLSRTCLILQNGTGNTPVTEATLELGASERTFTADAAKSKELSVTANVEWTAKSSASWLAVKTASGSGNGKIVYDVAANADTAARTGAITVTGSGLTRTFTVKQDGKTSGGGGDPTATLTLGATERTFTADAASGKELKVTANVSWTAKSSASWLVVKTASGTGNGKIVYNVAANTSASSRTATLTVSGGGLTRTFTVNQDGKSGPKTLHRQPAPRVWVTTSDGTDASAVVDNDESTAWSPTAPAPSWLALSFETPRPIESVEVLGENLPTGMRALLSPDANTWTEDPAPAATYLLLLLPAEGPLPLLREVSTQP